MRVSTHSKVLNQSEVAWVAPALVLTIFVLGTLAGVKMLRPEVSGSEEKAMPAGSVLSVRVEQGLSSKNERAGEEFKASVLSAATSDGTLVPMKGAWVRGRCVAVRGQEGPGRPGYLRLSLTDLHDGRGHVSPLMTSAVSQWGGRETTADHGSGPVGPRPITDAGRLEAEAQSQVVGEANITPDTPMSFVLLEPAAANKEGRNR